MKPNRPTLRCAIAAGFVAMAVPDAGCSSNRTATESAATTCPPDAGDAGCPAPTSGGGTGGSGGQTGRGGGW